MKVSRGRLWSWLVCPTVDCLRWFIQFRFAASTNHGWLDSTRKATGTFFLFVWQKWSIFPRTCPLRLGNLKHWINLQFDLWFSLWRSSIVPLRPFKRQKNRVRTHRKSDTARTILAVYSCSTSGRTKRRLGTKFERLRKLDCWIIENSERTFRFVYIEFIS